MLSPHVICAAATRCPQGALAQERGEHAQLVGSLQAMAAGLQSSPAEAQLRSELVRLAERVAVLTAAQVGHGGQGGAGQGHIACKARWYA